MYNQFNFSEQMITALANARNNMPPTAILCALERVLLIIYNQL